MPKRPATLSFTGEHLRAGDLQRMLAVISPVLGGAELPAPLPGFEDGGAPSGSHRLARAETILVTEIGGHTQGRDWIHTWTLTLTAPQGTARIAWSSWFDHAREVHIEVQGRPGAAAIAHDRLLEVMPELTSRSRQLFR